MDGDSDAGNERKIDELLDGRSHSESDSDSDDNSEHGGIERWGVKEVIGRRVDIEKKGRKKSTVVR